MSFAVRRGQGERLLDERIVEEKMAPARFRTFQDGRPDEERWELVDGAPVMMTPPSITHNRIASNLERLLNDALERQGSAREAVQRPGVELSLDASAPAGADAYRPEPDVAVIDYDPVPGRRFVERAYLLAEVLSGTDEIRAGDGARWIDVKVRLYRAHPPCTAILVLSQEEIAARLWRRSPGGRDAGWEEASLVGPDATLALDEFGLECPLAEIYRATHLRPR